MKRIVIPRTPEVSFPLLIVAVVAQFALSLPAATSSGFPPVDFFRVWVAPYLGFLGVLLFPLFDDDPTMRWAMRAMYSLGTILCLAWVLSNLQSEVPHQTTVVGSLKYALILAVPVYVLVWFLEQGAAWTWSRYRIFAEGSPAESRKLSRPFSIAAIVGAVLLLIVAVSLAQYYLTRPAGRREIGYTSQYHMDRILKALHAYRATYGTFPFHERGPDYALYGLRDLIDASVFDGRPRKDAGDRAAWDARLKRLVHSDFEYLNERDFVPSVESQRVVMMTKPFHVPGWVVLGMADGRSVWHKLRKPPASAVLGNWLTEDEFLIADRQVFEDWNKTHHFSRSTPRQGQTGLEKEYGDHELIRASDGKKTIEYEYSGHRLSGCRISNEQGTIVETIKTDDFGRITGIARSPDDWESISPSSKFPSS